MVEMISPMVRPQALDALYACADCMGNTTDWGIDHIWCPYVAKSLGRDRHSVCAILDHTGPVVHRNWQTSSESFLSLVHRSNSGLSQNESAGLADIRDIRAHHSR